MWVVCFCFFCLACFSQYISLRFFDESLVALSLLNSLIWISIVFSSFAFTKLILYCLPSQWAILFFIIEQGQHKPQQWQQEGLSQTFGSIDHQRRQLKKAAFLFMCLFLLLQMLSFYQFNHSSSSLLLLSFWMVLHRLCTSLFLVQCMFVFKSFLSPPFLQSLETFHQENPYRVCIPPLSASPPLSVSSLQSYP